MSQEERYGDRDRSYSAWHRRNSIGRFIDAEKARLLSMIDLDVIIYVEYDDSTKTPLILIETARDVGQYIKPATVTKTLAKMANIPAYTVLYSLSPKKNPADSDFFDIQGFRVRQLYPWETNWYPLTPERYPSWLFETRSRQIDRLLQK